MSLRINQNILALNSHGQLSITANRLEKSIEKLSSGLRINRAADDAAGLAISEKMRRTVRGISRAILNAQDGISMVQVAEGAMGEAQANLQRMRELAIQAANDTLTSNDRLEIQKEIVQLKDDLNRIAFNTEFNTKRLLDGSQAALVSSTSEFSRGIVKGVAVGGDYQISFTVVDGGVSEMLRSQTMTNVFDSSLAQGQTQLQSIAQFYDGNGAFAFESPQVVTINANGKSTEITIDKSTTLGFLAGSLASAIQSDNGLNMPTSSANAITTASTGIVGDGGYIEIVSGLVGEIGEITIAGENAVVAGLGFASTRIAVNSTVRASSIDVEGNTVSQYTNSDRVSGILQGIDVKFSSQAAQVASTGGLVVGINITADSTFTIAAIGGDAAIQITGTISAGTWTMEGLARYMDARAVATGVVGFDASVIDGDLRLTYDPTSLSLTNTFNLAGWTAAGITNLGLTDGARAGMTTGNRNEDADVWGFSRYQVTGADDIILSIADAVTGVDILFMSATGDVSAADLVTFARFYASATAVLQAATVQITIDQVGNNIVFTNLLLGQEISTTGAVTLSQITMNVSATIPSSETNLANTFGFQDLTTANGSGEKNFRFHVVSNTPQFQIGSERGQRMDISIGNVSVEALGLEEINLSSISGANKALGKISRALDIISGERSKLGAIQNRLDYAINNLRTMHSNMVAAESRIRDADIAMEMIEFTRNQIINQSGTAMLAQANLVPQGVLQLLR